MPLKQGIGRKIAFFVKEPIMRVQIRASCTSCGELRHLRIMCPRKNLNEEIATPARGIMKDETLDQSDDDA
ncbi:hypothetical protein LAZ67_12001507 [Cordylochernes scorpioides]|uniref:CCHC-type domain-containing protein n=1 Tax=Cordylochernes scorpioides TaxID=51811 RepID=A0ABY6L151_9ARAC|nr:hypothetical protein LAZ67_12001507 [Cordylochernes scorpioides]